MAAVHVGADVWAAIAKVVATPGQRRVAVAYIGVGAPLLLRELRRGDVLVCDASTRALRQGATFTSALRERHTRGVTIRSHSGLHAKVFVAGTRAFVGSANASKTSAGKQEAGVVVTAAEDVAALGKFVEDLATSPLAVQVDSSFLKLADVDFRPSRAGGLGDPLEKQPRSRPMHVVAHGDEAPTRVLQAAARQRDEVVPLIEDKSATIDWSWGERGSWRVSDVCVWVERRRGSAHRWLAEPPAVCVAAHPLGGRSKQIVYWWREPSAH